MANNFLVTKLKGSVDNDSLLGVGELRCKLEVPSGGVFGPNQSVRPYSGKQIEIELLDDGVTFSSASGGATLVDSKHGIFEDNYANTLTISGANEGDKVNVIIKPKYNIGTIGSKMYSIDASSLEYSTETTSIVVNALAFNGRLESFQNLTKLTRLSIDFNNKLKGDISVLGKCTALTRIALASIYGNFTGNWQEFVSAQKSNGRTSCTGLQVDSIYYCQIAFGSRSSSRIGAEEQSATLKWSGDKISLQNDTSKNVLTIGYTQEEANSAFPTYTIELCD